MACSSTSVLIVGSREEDRLGRDDGIWSRDEGGRGGGRRVR